MLNLLFKHLITCPQLVFNIKNLKHFDGAKKVLIENTCI